MQPLRGDVTGDGAVTQDDIDIILANMGREGDHLTTFHGDLNGDGVIDALDLAIAIGRMLRMTRAATVLAYVAVQ